mmetsp:Transcript_96486/g.242002  ORF Transcript_96486/g.242002 Transcript_96486/m.242002 type:complete len:141 (+) Transcript_96486:51-473(+)
MKLALMVGLTWFSGRWVDALTIEGTGHLRLRANTVAREAAEMRCGGMTHRDDDLPDHIGTPAPYCIHCRKCCDCNANSAEDCESSTVDVGGGSGAVVFCNTCESSCSHCPALDSLAACPGGDCCAPGWKHQPPFNATRGV